MSKLNTVFGIIPEEDVEKVKKLLAKFFQETDKIEGVPDIIIFDMMMRVISGSLKKEGKSDLFNAMCKYYIDEKKEYKSSNIGLSGDNWRN